MAKIKVIRNTYGGADYLKNALNYVNDERALCRGGYGVNPYNADSAYNQMMHTRNYFNKVSGNPLVHVVVAYNNSVNDLNTAASYGQQCAEYFANKYQVMYCTHNKDSSCGNYHTHMILNSVSYVNGAMIRTGFDEMNEYCKYVRSVTGQKCSVCFENKSVK